MTVSDTETHETVQENSNGHVAYSSVPPTCMSPRDWTEGRRVQPSSTALSSQQISHSAPSEVIPGHIYTAVEDIQMQWDDTGGIGM